MKDLKSIFYKSLVLASVTIASLQISTAQSSRKEREAEKIAHVQSIIRNKNFVFVAESMNPMGGRTMFLTYPYDLTITPEKINSDLPYFGRAYSLPVDPTRSVLQFTSNDFVYDIKSAKKGGWDVSITPKDNREVRQMSLSISASGYAYLQVLSNNRQAITFNGRVEEFKAKQV